MQFIQKGIQEKGIQEKGQKVTDETIRNAAAIQKQMNKIRNIRDVISSLDENLLDPGLPEKFKLEMKAIRKEALTGLQTRLNAFNAKIKNLEKSPSTNVTRRKLQTMKHIHKQLQNTIVYSSISEANLRDFNENIRALNANFSVETLGGKRSSRHRSTRRRR
jgi:hypothetical protein